MATNSIRIATRDEIKTGIRLGGQAAGGGIRGWGNAVAYPRLPRFPCLPRGPWKVARGMRGWAAALPVVVETGFFLYEERRNQDAYRRGEQTREETRCITCKNAGRHGAAAALGLAGAAAGAKMGGVGGTLVAPGAGTGVGAVVGGALGGIVGCVVGGIGGGTAGERLYRAKARRGADRGDRAADCFLGGYHYKRIRPGRDRHVAEARMHLECAAEGGYAQAKTFLGMMAWNGTGMATDRAKAVALWRETAGEGDEEAMYLAGRALLAGEGREADPEAGHALMREAAARGCKAAIAAFPAVDGLYQAWAARRQESIDDEAEEA